MRSGLTAGISSELSKGQVNLVFFVEVEFASGLLNLWSGVGDISWDSKTWIGAGDLLMIQPARETTGGNATGLTLSLTGVNPAYIALALNEARQNKPVKCYFGFLDSSGAIITDPYQFFKGLVNYIVIGEGGDSAIITVYAENDLIKLQQPRIRRYTDQDQQSDFPNDLGFIHVAAIQEWNGFWGGGDVNATDSRSDGGTQRDASEASAEVAAEKQRVYDAGDPSQPTEGGGYDPWPDGYDDSLDDTNE